MKEKFVQFLNAANMKEEFCTTLMDCGIFRDLSELCSKIEESEEWVAEAFPWVLSSYKTLDAEWRIACGTKKRFYDKKKGFGV